MHNLEVRMDPRTTAETLIKRLQDAWNAADGAAFGAPFAPDADFVTIRGELHSGEAIAAGHQQIFDTIYAGRSVQGVRNRLLINVFSRIGATGMLPIRRRNVAATGQRGSLMSGRRRWPRRSAARRGS